MILDISKSFKDNLIPGASKAQIGRIVDAYKKSKAEQNISASYYQVSREWLPIYAGFMGEVMAALQSGDIDSLTRMYENFFREKLSTGLHGLHFEMVEKYMTPGREIAASDLKAAMDIFQLYAKMFLISNRNVSLDVLRRPPFGNAYGYNLDGTTLYIGAEYHYHYSALIQRFLKKIEKPIVFELGGGFGGMAYYLMRDTVGLTYIAADLPENAALQAYYLMSHFPSKKIALYGEIDLKDFHPHDYDAVILPNFAIDSLNEDVAHLSFNSYSLAEMDVESVNNYVAKICNITSLYFYHLNHVFWPVSADNFPIDYDKFELHLRFPTMWGRDPRNCQIDHHEYVYMRK